jgi:hypothetical protein
MGQKIRSQYLTSIEASKWRLFLLQKFLTLPLLEIKATTSPFLFLAVDLPPPPLFQDAVEKNIIPQVGIHTVLAKYDGVKTQVRFDS